MVKIIRESLTGCKRKKAFLVKKCSDLFNDFKHLDRGPIRAYGRKVLILHTFSPFFYLRMAVSAIPHSMMGKPIPTPTVKIISAIKKSLALP